METVRDESERSDGITGDQLLRKGQRKPGPHPLIHWKEGGRKEGQIRTMRKNTESITSRVMIRACLDRPIAMESLETVVQRRMCEEQAVGRGSPRNVE